MVLWIEGAPTIGKDKPEEVLKWIQERITCRMPDENTNPEALPPGNKVPDALVQ